MADGRTMIGKSSKTKDAPLETLGCRRIGTPDARDVPYPFSPSWFHNQGLDQKVAKVLVKLGHCGPWASSDDELSSLRVEQVVVGSRAGS